MKRMMLVILALTLSLSVPVVRADENVLTGMLVEVGDETFAAKLYDNDTTRALLEMLPLTLDMSELNGNEKYFYLPEDLPTDSGHSGSIRNGDLMLYGSNCLVLFYEDFTTDYSYTQLGYVENPEGLAEALGGGNVNVVFNLADEEEEKTASAPA